MDGSIDGDEIEWWETSGSKSRCRTSGGDQGEHEVVKTHVRKKRVGREPSQRHAQKSAKNLQMSSRIASRKVPPEKHK